MERTFGILTLEESKTPIIELIYEGGEAPGIETLGSVIHGKDDHGNPVSLLSLGSARDSWKQGPWSAGMGSLTVSVGYVLLGIHVVDADSLKFHHYQQEIQHLTGWYNKSGFSEDSHIGGSDKVIRYRPPEPEQYKISDDLELRLKVCSRTHDRCVAGSRDLQIREWASLEFCSSKGLSLKRCRRLTSAMRMLLHFACLQPVYTVQLTGQIKDHNMPVGDGTIGQDIRIVNGNLHENRSERAFSEKWVFQFSDIANDFATRIVSWLEFCDRMEEPLGCYARAIYHRLPLIVEHLCLTQALEAYHGINHQSLHQSGFRRKIVEVCHPHIGHLTGIVDNLEDFGNKVEHSRNYYTHHNPKWQAEKGEELFRLNEALKLIFQICVLSDLGIDAGKFSRLRSQLASTIIEAIDS